MSCNPHTLQWGCIFQRYSLDFTWNGKFLATILFLKLKRNSGTIPSVKSLLHSVMVLSYGKEKYRRKNTSEYKLYSIQILKKMFDLSNILKCLWRVGGESRVLKFDHTQVLASTCGPNLQFFCCLTPRLSQLKGEHVLHSDVIEMTESLRKIKEFTLRGKHLVSNSTAAFLCICCCFSSAVRYVQWKYEYTFSQNRVSAKMCNIVIVNSLFLKKKKKTYLWGSTSSQTFKTLWWTCFRG